MSRASAAGDMPWCSILTFDPILIRFRTNFFFGRCETESEALAIKAALKKRLAECGLEMHPDKTHVVYCKDGSRKEKHPNTKFDFLGYSFRPRVVKNRKRNSLFVSFTPAVSSSALKSMRETTRKFNLRNRTELSLQDISRLHNPVLRG